MLQLSDRKRQIIFYLFSKEIASAKALSTIFSVSEKTIRNDMKNINKVCNAPMITPGPKGYSFDYTFEDILSQIPIVSSSEEDDASHILFLLLNEAYINFYDLADKLCVSESTLNNRLHTLKETLEKYNLKISREKQNLSISGASQDKRNLYVQLVLDEVGSNFYDVSKFEKYFTNINVNEIIVVFQQVLNNISSSFPSSIQTFCC